MNLFTFSQSISSSTFDNVPLFCLNFLKSLVSGIQNCINQMVHAARPSIVRAPFKTIPRYNVATSGILIAPDGRPIPPAVYNCFDMLRQPLTSMDSNQEDNNLCAICNDKASGNHYSVPSCEGCKVYMHYTYIVSFSSTTQSDGFN